MNGKTYEDRLECLRLWTLEERRNRQDLIEVFKMFRGFSNISLYKLFILDTNSKGTRGHTCKLVKIRCTYLIFFQARSLMAGTWKWNLLDKRTVDAPSINAFKSI